MTATPADRPLPETGRKDVLFVLGSRPEIIRLAPVIRRLAHRARIVHVGQHYDPEMSGRIWDAMDLPHPEAVIGAGGGGRGAQIAAALDRLDAIVAANRPNVVVVQGDTNATLAGALVANAHGVPLVHVEAGLRSHDRAMPEEHNRVLVDHLADVLCAPTWPNVDNLLAEGIPVDRVHLTGNTIVDAVRSQLPAPDAVAAVLRDYGVADGGYVVATVHRPENTDDPGVLSTILDELAAIDVPVLLPLHPRTRERIRAAWFDDLLGPVRVLDPLVPAQFLALCAGAAALVSDSGGLQEVCSVLKRPLVVVRSSTERPEVMGTFAERVLPGPDISRIVNRWCADVDGTRRRLATLPSPYGTEHSPDHIARVIVDAARAVDAADDGGDNGRSVVPRRI